MVGVGLYGSTNDIPEVAPLTHFKNNEKGFQKVHFFACNSVISVSFFSSFSKKYLQ